VIEDLAGFQNLPGLRVIASVEEYLARGQAIRPVKFEERRRRPPFRCDWNNHGSIQSKIGHPLFRFDPPARPGVGLFAGLCYTMDGRHKKAPGSATHWGMLAQAP